MKRIDLDKHLQFFNKLAKGIPEQAHGSYMTALFFTVAGLNLLGHIDLVDKKALVDWVYTQQNVVAPYAGFRANSSNILPIQSMWDYSSLASTYSALCMLKILGDDFSRVCKREILESIRFQISEDGSVYSHPNGVEKDMRFVYCACAVCYILNDWEGIDKELLTCYILECQTIEGSFALGIDMEGHGGATYCAISALSLLGKLAEVPKKSQLIEWLVMRQGKGFQGRLGKAEDTCYGYWIGLSLSALSQEKFINYSGNLEFYQDCEGLSGGFGKYPGVQPDPTHSYLGLCAVSMLGVNGLKKIIPPLGIPWP